MHGAIGELAFAEVQDIVRSILYSAEWIDRAPMYVGQGSWDGALDDVIQTVVLDELLAQGQYKYAIETARHLDDLRGLIGGRVHRCLKRMRARSVIDVLLDRARDDYLMAPPFEAHDLDAAGRPDGFQLAGLREHLEMRRATEEEIAVAARNATVVPTLRSGATERSPRVYGPSEFRLVLVTSCESFPALLHIESLRAILNRVLTDWVVASLVDSEEALTMPSSTVDPSQQAVERENAREFIAGLDDDGRELLRQMLAGYRDGESATHFNCSRQTVNGRKGSLRVALAGRIDVDDQSAGTVFLEEIQMLLAGSVGRAQHAS